jgi:hypothetical protein
MDETIEKNDTAAEEASSPEPKEKQNDKKTSARKRIYSR